METPSSSPGQSSRSIPTRGSGVSMMPGSKAEAVDLTDEGQDRVAALTDSYA